MKHTVYPGICLLLLVGAAPMAACGLDLYWGTDVVTVLPDYPNTDDTVSISLAGEWPNDCIPGDADVYMAGQNLFFDVLDYSMYDYCWPIPTPYGLGPYAGGLALGDHDVYVSVYECDPIFGGCVLDRGPDWVGTFTVRMPGDVDANCWVDVFDVIDTVNAFGSAPGHPKWNARCDFDHDGQVSVFDVITVVSKFGTNCP